MVVFPNRQSPTGAALRAPGGMEFYRSALKTLVQVMQTAPLRFFNPKDAKYAPAALGTPKPPCRRRRFRGCRGRRG
jgi:hypothetical protein